MSRSLLALTTVLLLTACTPDIEDVEDTGSEETEDTGSEETEDTGSGETEDTGAEDAEAGPPEWTGSWRLESDWEASCWVPGLSSGRRTFEGSDTWLIEFSGTNSDLQASLFSLPNWYTLLGTADSSALFVCGMFPMPVVSGEIAPPGPENMICLGADEVVSAKRVNGLLFGLYNGPEGEKCQIEHASAELTKVDS